MSLEMFNDLSIIELLSLAVATSIDALAVGITFAFLKTNILISALTIGGKAMGKSFAINKSDIILYGFAKFVSTFYKK